MTEVRTSSRSERPCAGIEDTPEASIGTGGRGEQRHRKVHSLIDKVYDRTNLTEAWQHVRENEGNLWILDADLRSYFDKIDQERLIDLIAEEISDGRVLHLIRSFLEAGVIVDGAWEPTKTGVPQGGVASPLWSNIYLTPFDHAMTKAGYRLTRWADDFVVVCPTYKEAERALAIAPCERSSGLN